MTPQPEWFFKNRSDQEKANNAAAVVALQAFFDDKLGLFVYPAYGTLLGAIRERDFIGSDVDIDMCWHSQGETRADVLRDVLRVFQELEINKIFARPGNYAGRCKAKIGDGTAYHGDVDVTNIDLSVSWVEDGIYHTSDFGAMKEIDITPVPAELRGLKVKVPSGAEDFLRLMYGDWRTPRTKGFRNPELVWGSYLLR